MIPYKDKKKRPEEQTPLRTTSQATPVLRTTSQTTPVLRTTSQTASSPVANITNTTPPPAVEPLATVQPQFTSMHQDELGRLYDEIKSKSGFNYNPSGDPLWAQSVASTMAQGQRAMRDTMGQAAALTGGYGSSYAQNVGQQAYNQLIEGLMAQAPQFEDAARARHSAELDSLYQQYALLQDKEDSDYNRWLTQWEVERQAQQDEQAQKNWQAEFDEDQRRYEESKSSGGSSGGYSGSSSRYVVDDYMQGVVQNLVDEGVTIKDLQFALSDYYNDVTDDFVSFIWDLMQNTSPRENGYPVVYDGKTPGVVHTPW